VANNWNVLGACHNYFLVFVSNSLNLDLLKILITPLFHKSCALNNKLHSFAFYLLVTDSSACEKVLRPKSTRLVAAVAAVAAKTA
jgi:hypothetical protein